MIELDTEDGKKLYLAYNAISEVIEANTSSQWHGIKSYVKIFNGKTYGVSNTCSEIAKKVREHTPINAY